MFVCHLFSLSPYEALRQGNFLMGEMEKAKAKLKHEGTGKKKRKKKRVHILFYRGVHYLRLQANLAYKAYYVGVIY